MKAKLREAFVLLASVFLLGTAVVAAQRDEGPVLLPKPKPASPTLLVMCDLACNWKLDGVAQGRIEAGSGAKAKVELGQHVVFAATEDTLDMVEVDVEIKASGQTVQHLALQPVRDARLKAEHQALDKAAREARAGIEQEERNEATRMQELHDHAAERLETGRALADQKRYAEANPLLQKACDGGDMRGCNLLGLFYQDGHGVAQDDTQARTLYQKACDGGYMLGCNNLGSLYENGLGTGRDYAQARTLYQEACDGRDMLGCNNLGWLYENGLGAGRDYPRARTLFQKACSGGEMIGCNNLGWLYQNGLGVAQDYAQARAFYQKGCDGGYQKACTNLMNLK